MTMVKIATVEVGASPTSNLLEFTNIPQTFTDLLIVCSLRSSRTGFPGDDTSLWINGSSASITQRSLQGSGSGVSSITSSPTMMSTASNTANTFSSLSILVTNYASTSAYKSVSVDAVTENNAAAAYQIINAQQYGSNSAITAFGVYSATGSIIQQYSTATLYGITKGNGLATVS